MWHSVGVSSSISGQSSSSGIYQVPLSSFIRTSPFFFFFFSAPLFSAWEESSLTHVITKIIPVFLHHTYPSMMESNFASWKAGVKFALSHMCRLGCFCIPDTSILRSSLTPLSGCMNRSILAPSWIWCLWREHQGFDEGSRLGSRQGRMFFCGFSADWFPSTVLKHANSLDWSLSCVWNHPIPNRAPTMV